MIGDKILNEGDLLSLDGNTGTIYLGRLNQVLERPDRALASIAVWKEAGRLLRRSI
jgi:pyruvate,orthophosphate dikinase